MSLNNFIPQLWADTMLAALRKALVFGSLFNDDYEGEISKMGDTVRINAIGDIAISDYTKDTDLNAAQALTDSQTMLTISKAKYYNFEVDDVDQAQAHPEVMTEAMNWAAYRMADTMDQFYAGFYADVPSTNSIGSSGTPTVPTLANLSTSTGIGSGTGVYDYLVILGQYLTQNNVPKQGRWAVIPPWCTTLLTQDLRFSSFNTPDAKAVLTEGKLDASAGQAADSYIGRIARMDVYESNNCYHIGGTVGASGSQDVVLAGHSMAYTKAEGLKKTEAYRHPLRFADAVKGLALFGAKTVRPYAGAVAYLQHP